VEGNKLKIRNKYLTGLDKLTLSYSLPGGKRHTMTVDIPDKAPEEKIVDDRIPDHVLTGVVSEKGPMNIQNISSVRDIPRVTMGNPHPTVKAIDVMDWLIGRLTEEGDTILDPFAGSGTTGVAGTEGKRNVHLVELDETGNYSPVIKARLREAKEQGQKTSVFETVKRIELDLTDEPDD
jgi:DNA modification methylase